MGLSKTTQETIIPYTVEEDLDQLTQNKLDLEKQLHDLNEQQTKLTLQAKNLCEQITQEIKKRNAQKRQAINQLRQQFAQIENTAEHQNSIAETTIAPTKILPGPATKPEIHAAEFNKKEETFTPLDVFPL